MSRLFHRLAAQATGSAGPSVHSLARIPYVAPLELAEEVQAPNAPPPRSEQPRPTATEPTRPSRAALDTRAPPRAASTETISSEPPPLMPSSSPDSPKRPATEHVAPLDVPVDNTPGALLDADAQPSEHRLRAALPSVLRVPQTDPEQQPEPAHSTPPQAERPSAPTPNSVPDPLLRPSRPTQYQRGSVRPHNLGQSFETRKQDESETTEVHVHIGRIEVTAVHEAPPDKPKRPPVRGPMSLDEYLTRRKEERR
jgi:hypothetical protein